jgi:hypothetical protein
MYGSATGLKKTTKRVISQNSSGIPDVAETGDQYGSAVASADLDGDGYADLVVSASGEDVGRPVPGPSVPARSARRRPRYAIPYNLLPCCEVELAGGFLPGQLDLRSST